MASMAVAREQAALERRAVVVETAARAEARQAGATRQEAREAGLVAARQIVPDWSQARRENRQMRDRWERCRRRWRATQEAGRAEARPAPSESEAVEAFVSAKRAAGFDPDEARRFAFGL